MQSPNTCSECRFWGERGGDLIEVAGETVTTRTVGFCFADPHAVERGGTDPACRFSMKTQKTKTAIDSSERRG